MQREIFMTATFFLTLLYQSKRYNCTLFLTINLFFLPLHNHELKSSDQTNFSYNVTTVFAYLLLDIFDTDERLASRIHIWSSSHVIYT